MSKIAQIYYYDPQSAGINLQSLQSESTPRRLTLLETLQPKSWYSADMSVSEKNLFVVLCAVYDTIHDTAIR